MFGVKVRMITDLEDPRRGGGGCGASERATLSYRADSLLSSGGLQALSSVVVCRLSSYSPKPSLIRAQVDTDLVPPKRMVRWALRRVAL